MTHGFDIDHAARYGVEEAIMLQHFIYWLSKNRANGRNQVEGSTWTFNSAHAFSQLFPYWTPKQVRRILDSLESQGVIKVGCFNNNPFDRARWFSFVKEGDFLGNIHLPDQENLIFPNGKIPLSQVGKSVLQFNNQVITKEEAHSARNPTTSESFPEVLRTPKFCEAWSNWLADRKQRRKPVTDRAAKIQLKNLSAWGEQKAIQAIENAIEAGWQKPYEPNERNGYGKNNGAVNPRNVGLCAPTTSYAEAGRRLKERQAKELAEQMASGGSAYIVTRKP